MMSSQASAQQAPPKYGVSRWAPVSLWLVPQLRAGANNGKLLVTAQQQSMSGLLIPLAEAWLPGLAARKGGGLAARSLVQVAAPVTCAVATGSFHVRSHRREMQNLTHKKTDHYTLPEGQVGHTSRLLPCSSDDPPILGKQMPTASYVGFREHLKSSQLMAPASPRPAMCIWWRDNRWPLEKALLGPLPSTQPTGKNDGVTFVFHDFSHFKSFMRFCISFWSLLIMKIRRGTSNFAGIRLFNPPLWCHFSTGEVRLGKVKSFTQSDQGGGRSGIQPQVCVTAKPSL